MKILMGVVNYNRLSDLKLLLPRLRKIRDMHIKNGADIGILVVDNDSEYRTQKFLKEQRDIEVRYLPRNVGGAGGFAALQSEAIRRQVDYLMMMDNDALPGRTFLRRAVEYMEQQPSVGVVGGQVLARENLDRIVECGAYVSYDPLGVRPAFVGDKRRPPGEVYQPEYIATQCVVVRGSCLADAGTMDPEYFLHWDDIEWSFRIRERGWKLHILTSCVASHPRPGSREPSPFQRYLDERNSLWFAEKWAAGQLRAIRTQKRHYWRYHALFGDVAEAAVIELALRDGSRHQPIASFPQPPIMGRDWLLLVPPFWTGSVLDELIKDLNRQWPELEKMVIGNPDKVSQYTRARCMVVGEDGRKHLRAWTAVRRARKRVARVAIIVPRGGITAWHVLGDAAIVWWGNQFLDLPSFYRNGLTFLSRTIFGGPGVMLKAFRRVLSHAPVIGIRWSNRFGE